jgi:DnaJ family protein C protein 22
MEIVLKIYNTWHFSGGYFGAGWIRDVWRIPAYVREANDDPFYLKDITEKMRTLKKPPFSVHFFELFFKWWFSEANLLFQFARLGGQLIVGNLFGMLMAMSVPDPKDIGVDLLLVADLLAPAATAFG